MRCASLSFRFLGPRKCGGRWRRWHSTFFKSYFFRLLIPIFISVNLCIFFFFLHPCLSFFLFPSLSLSISISFTFFHSLFQSLSHSLHLFLSFIFPIFPVSFYLLYFPNHSLFHSLYHSLYHFRYFYLSLHLFLSFIFPVFPCIIIFHSSSKSFSLSFPVTFSLFNDPYLSLFHYFTFLHSFFSLFPCLRENGPSPASF